MSDSYSERITTEIRKRSKRILKEEISASNINLIVSEEQMQWFDSGVATAIGVTIKVLKEEGLMK